MIFGTRVLFAGVLQCLCKNFVSKKFNLVHHQFRYKMYSTIERGSLNTPNYRMFFTDGNGPISPFHDIPIYADKENRIYHMVVEIPRWTNAKMEIATKEPLNPIKQDSKKGQLRNVANVFPHHGYIWNYGALPQTWEDPNHIDEATKCKGDNDPIDVCEIGFRVAQRGEVIQVKILGAFALIDEGETDWKLLAIDTEDPIAEKLNDIEDIEEHMPGLLAATYEWFKIYKVPSGNPENKFAFDGEPKKRAFAEEIIEETHKFWQKLVSNPNDSSGLSCVSVTADNSPYTIGIVEASTIIDSSPDVGPSGTVDAIADKWHFVKLKHS